MATIQANELTDTIMKALDDFKGQTLETVKNAANFAAKEALSELHNAHPSGSEKYGSWDKYNNDWAIKDTSTKATSVTVTVYNRKHYRLTHLLEKGHALRQGGRTKAFPHIAPAEETAERTFMNRIKSGI